MNILDRHFAKDICLKTIRTDSQLSLESFEVYDAGLQVFRESILYLIKPDELPSGEELAAGLNFLCYGLPEAFELNTYRHINLLILTGMSEQKILNGVIAIFHQLTALDERLDALIYRNFSLQEIIDLATEMIKMPLNVLDLNHNVLAISSQLNAKDDPLWDAMKAGRDYSDYDMIIAGDPKMSDIIQAPGSAVEMRSNISGHYIKVSILFNKGHAVATCGMHKSCDLEVPFGRDTTQLYDYFVEKLNRNFNRFFEEKADRGLLYEEFLHDLFNRKLTAQTEIEDLATKLGFKPGSRYLMGLISLRDSSRTDCYFTMLDYLERIIPDSKCIAMDAFIYIIIPIADDVYLAHSMQSRLTEFLAIHNCLCLLSPAFRSFDELYKINAMFKTVLTLINDPDNRIYPFHEYADRYSIWLLTENMPAETITHPMIEQIIDYDEKHHSDYLETLKCYFRNACCVATTASQLHMHRNSLLYRINRIEKLLETSLDDWQLRAQLLFFMTCRENRNTLKNK
jgi:hypothetical protein